MTAPTQQATSGEETALTIPTRKPAEIRVVTDPIAVLDTARFEHMQRIASVMAQSNLIPDGLCITGSGDEREYLPPAKIVANCFLVVNQAVRWGMDPFAVAQCVSVVHGKLCYEGKLIAAVIEAKLGIRLQFKWDNGQGDNLGIVVSGQFPEEHEPRTVSGTVGEWKTTGNGSPWTAKQSRKMLAYRGTREWARLHAPGLMLGVYSDDELADISDDVRANRARNVTPIEDARQARIERPRPPNPNAEATAPPNQTADRPRPPNPDAASAKGADRSDPGDIPQALKHAKPLSAEEAAKLEAALITDIARLDNMSDCAVWARDTRQMKSGLPADAQNRIEVAFLKRQEALQG